MTKAQLLVADNDPGFAAALAANLESLGYTVTEVVSSPEEALAKAQETQPDLILLDLGWLQDGKKGKAVRELQERFPQGLLYLAPDGDRQTLKQAKITRSFDYLRRAYDSRELETIIEMALYRQKLEGAIREGEEARGRQRRKSARQSAIHAAEMKQATADLQIEVDRHQRREAEHQVNMDKAATDHQAKMDKAAANQEVEMDKAAADLQSEIHRGQLAEAAALQAERQKLYQVLDTLPVYVVLLTPDHEVPFANQEFIKRFGAPEGRKCYDFLFGRTSPCPDCETYKVLGTNAPHEWDWTGPDGRDYQIYDFPFPDTDGSPLILEMGVDVTVLKEKEVEITKMAAALQRSYDELEARVQDRTRELAQSNAKLQTEIAERLWSEKKLRESEERYRLLVELSPDAIAVYSQGRLVFINPAGAQVFGAADSREILAQEALELVHPDYREAVNQRLRRLTAEGGRTKLREIKILRLDGREVDVEASAVGITFQGQAAVQVMLRDISRRKEMERKLEHLASFPRLNPNPVLEVDASRNIAYANEATFQVLEKLGLGNATKAFLPADLDEIVKTVRERGESVFQREVKINGRVFNEVISFAAEFEVFHIYTTDITARKRAERERQELLEKLQASEEELQVQNEELHSQTEELQVQTEELLASNQQLILAHEALAESQRDLNRAQAVAHTGSWRLNVRKNELLWSDENHRIFGIPRGMPLNYETFLATLHPEDREYVDRKWSAALRGEPYDIEHRIVADGQVKWVRERAELEFDAEGRLLGGFGTTQDITARKEGEFSLKVSRDFLEISNRHSQMAPLLQDYATTVQDYTGCEAVAIRILDEEGNIPYEAYTGFSEEFVASESRLCVHSDRCLCINVVQGTTDPSLPCYTPGASCYINRFSHLVAATPPGLLGETRNVCHHFGYESVALIPIVFRGDILGLIHLADCRENMVPLALVERLEGIALTLGTAINRVRAQERLHQALSDARQRQAEIAALLTATRAVLETREFPDISRAIYDSCKELIGASAGYIALLSPDGQENDILFLDTGNIQCTVDPSLPMPVRGLRAEAYRACETVYDNDFARSAHAKFLPGGHVGLDNVLFSPLVVKGKAVGLLGLGNKPGGYDENDARLAAGFGELAAMALVNKRAEDERERLIRELATERARLQAIIASAPEAIVVVDEEGRLLMTNPAADQLYSHPDGCVQDAPSCALFQFCRADGTACVPGDQPLHRSAILGESHRNLEMMLAWPDGRHRDLLVNTAPILDREGRSSGAVGLFQDITELKQGELELARRTAEFEAIFNSITDAVVFADTRGRVVMVNPAMTAIWGYGPEELSGRTTEFLYARKTDYKKMERQRYHPDRGQDHQIFQVPYRRKDGTVFIGETLGSQVRDAAGKVLGYVGIHRDITQRKESEAKIHKLNLELSDRVREVSERTRQLEVANKELEAFSYSVSHDLRTPLRAIEGFARMLQEDYLEKLDVEGLRLLEVIRSNTRLMAELIDDLLALSRLGRQEIRAQKIDLGGLATSVFGELKTQAPQRRLELIVEPMPPGFGDRSLINQVLVNLLGNAVKFTKPRKKAIIEVGGWTEGKENIYFVKDNGVGFDMRYVGKIFGVFQRLHRREEFEGTGVGLALVQRIINRHGGRVWATGRVDKGAVFYFALPRKGGGK